jgi:RHS repeat-associated protein
VAWPAPQARTFLDGVPAEAGDWVGSLIKDQRDASGLLYRRNRYYDPYTGQFTQEDPIGVAGGFNLYGFAGGDPVNSADPFGLSACVAVPTPECIRQMADAAMEAAAEGIAMIGHIYREIGSEIASAAVPVVGVLRRIGRIKYLDDFASGNTKFFSAMFGSEGEARALARQKVGHNPVEVGDGKWRSRDGRWQYRAKAGDVSQGHVHIEELNPNTGEVLQNWHLRWEDPR